MKKALGFAVLLLGPAPAICWAGVAEERLAQAARANEHALIKNLLANKANPNAPLADKSTPLIWAVDRQNEQSVRLLLGAGAKPNVADIQRATPLAVACELGNPEIVVSLIKAGASAGTVRPDGTSALALCAAASTPAAVGALIAKGAKMNGADAQGLTPLMWAAARGNADTIAFLVKQGANANAVAAKGFTPLFFALKSRDARSPVILLEAGADLKARLPDGTTVAEAAVLQNNMSFAKQVVILGADLNQRDNDGRQLIHVASASGNPELVTFLLSKGADPNVLSQPAPAPPRRPAPLQVAGAGGGSGGTNAKGLAIADGAIKAPPVVLYPTPPLLFAARSGSADVMKALVTGGAKPDIQAQDGMNLTMAAAYSGNLEAVKYALELNPDLNVQDQSGKGVMHMAVSNPQSPEAEAVIAYLADKGAKLDAKDKRGRTPSDSVQENIREFYNAQLKRRGLDLDRLGPANASAVNAAN
jgi:ankyrin repeat protein